MVNIKPFRYLYPLFHKLHFKILEKQYCVWCTEIFIFLQYSILQFISIKPTENFTTKGGFDFFYFLNGVFFMLPSIFGTTEMLYDAAIWFCASIIISIVLGVIAYRVYKKKFVPFWLLTICRAFPQFVIPILSFPLFFRLAFSIERIIDFHDYRTILTLVFFVLTTIIFFLYYFITAVFLMNFCIVYQTYLDQYDGKSYVFLWFSRFYYTVTFLLIPLFKDYYWSLFFVILDFIVLVALLYRRVLTVVHVSLYGLYLEMTPLFCFPFIFITFCYGSLQWAYCVALIITLDIIFAFIINFIRIYMKNLSFRVFGPYIHHDTSFVSIPNFLPGNLSNIVRIMSIYNSDPSVFARFMINQKQTRIRTSVLIELCRFFSIFPEMRELMLNEILDRESNSIFNDYLLSIFELRLTSLSQEITSNDELKELDQLYTEFTAHSYFYWQARKEKSYPKAFFESLSVAYLYLEVDYELQALSRLYPLSSTLYHISAEIAIIINGDFESYKKINKFANKLEETDQSIDPILHQVGMENPKVLQYSSATTSIASSLLRSSSSETFHRIRTTKRKQSHMAVISKLVKSDRKLPYVHYLHYILPCVLVIISAFYCFPFKNVFETHEVEIKVSTNELQPVFYSAASTSFVSRIYSYRDVDSEMDCSQIYYNFTRDLFTFYQQSSFSPHVQSLMLFSTINEITSMYALHNNDVCDVLQVLSNDMDIRSFNQTELLIEQSHSLLAEIQNTKDIVNDEFNFISMMIINAVVFIVFLIIYFSIFCYAMNSIMKDNLKAIEFLSSKAHVASIVEKLEYRKNFWNFFDPSLLATSDSSIPLEESETRIPLKLTPSRFQSSASSSANILRINFATPTDSYLSTNNDETSETDNENHRIPMKLTPKYGLNSSFTGSGLNVLKQPRAFEMDEEKSKLEPSTISDDHFKSVHDFDISSTNEENLYNEEELSGLLTQIESNGTKYPVMYIVLMLIPWILLLLVVIMLIYPVKYNANNDIEIIETIHDMALDVIESFYLLNSSLIQMNTGYCNSELYLEIDKLYYNKKSQVGEFYNKERCFVNETETLCFTIHSILLQMIDKTYTDYMMVAYFIQSIVSFSEECLHEILLNYVNRDRIILRSYGSSFYVLAALAIIILIIYGFQENFALRKGLNSLFHFPSFEDKSKDSEQKEISTLDTAIKIPSNAILVTSVAETDEIYSISDTCGPILNKKSSELICRKFNKAFPIVSSDEFEIRECNGKMFISKSKRNGTLIKTLLIENPKNESKIKQANVQKLINFIPNIFVKSFSEEFVNGFQFQSCFLIFVRIDSKAGQIESFINNLHNKVEQMYFGIEFIRSNGSILTYISRENDNLEIMLFIRDVIQQAEESSKKQSANYALRSIYVDYLKELNVDIVDGGTEPFAQFEEQQFYQMEDTTFLVDDKCIGGSKYSFLARGKMREFSVVEEFNGAGQLLSMPFPTFVQKIDELMV